jgi:hypothetical protein
MNQLLRWTTVLVSPKEDDAEEASLGRVKVDCLSSHACMISRRLNIVVGLPSVLAS